MEPSKFEGQNVVIAEHQPEYTQLPALVSPLSGEAIFCWRLTWRERLKLLVTGRLWHRVLTFGQPLQPQLLGVDVPELVQAVRKGDRP